MEPAAPEQEVEYPLRLGASFTSAAPPQLYTLRYDFKPDWLSRTRPAGVVAVGKDANVAVQFDAPSEGKAPASFQGNLVAGTPGGLDCVLLFDGKEFRLEKLEGQVKSLRQIRNEANSKQIEQARATLAAYKRRRELDGDSDDDAVDAGEGRRADVTTHGQSISMMRVDGGMSMSTAAGITAAAASGEQSLSDSDSDDDLGKLGGSLSSLWDPPGLSPSPAQANTSTPPTPAPAPAPAAPLAQLPRRFSQGGRGGGGGGEAMATGADSSSDSSSSDSESD